MSDTRIGHEHGEYSPAMASGMSTNGVVMVSAIPGLSISVLKTIPSDSPQVMRQNATKAVRKNIEAVRWRPVAKISRDTRRLETISNGTSRIRYTKKNEPTEYAPSAYSCRGFE